MFPFSFGRTIEIPIIGNTMESASDIMLNALAQRIRAKKPSSFSSNQRQIKFSGGFLRFIGNWNLLAPIDYGVIDIKPNNNRILVSYKLWFTGLFLLASLITIMFAFAIFSSGITFQNFVMVIGIWLWFFGVNFIVTVIRFHNLVRSALEG